MNTRKTDLKPMQKYLRPILFLCLVWMLTPLGIANAEEWVARHGLTSAQYQSTFTDLAKNGYRLNVVSGYTDKGQERYAALWVKTAGPEWAARHGLSSADYQHAFNDFIKKGFRLVYVSGYTVNNQPRFAAIWEKSSGPAWEARHGLTSAQYQSTFNDLVKKGYRLKVVSGYAVNGQDFYAAIWDKSAGPAWVARHGLSSAQYQSTFDDLVKQGYRLKIVSGYAVNGRDFYAAIWDKSAGPAWVARHGLTSAAYQNTFNDLTGKGYRLGMVSGYQVGSEDRYAAFWEKTR